MYVYTYIYIHIRMTETFAGERTPAKNCFPGHMSKSGVYYASDASNSFSKRFRVYDDWRTRGGIAGKVEGERRACRWNFDGARRPFGVEENARKDYRKDHRMIIV